MATFTYDTYGKLLSRTGRFKPIFLYNGRDGVVTDPMRARYYSPELRRFMNADLLAGDISDARTLNRYSYVCGDPVSFVDPFGLEAERSANTNALRSIDWEQFTDKYFWSEQVVSFMVSSEQLELIYAYLMEEILAQECPNNIGAGLWAKMIHEDIDWVEKNFGPHSKAAKFLEKSSYIQVFVEETVDGFINISKGMDVQHAVVDAAVDISYGVFGVAFAGAVSSFTSGLIAGTALGSAVPVAGTIIGAVVGAIVGVGYYYWTECHEIEGRSVVEATKDLINGEY